METLIDYGLVILFFVGLAAFVAVVLLKHPYTEPVVHTEEIAKSIRTERAKRVRTQIGDMLGYGLVAVVLGGLFVLTFLSERKHA